MPDRFVTRVSGAGQHLTTVQANAILVTAYDMFHSMGIDLAPFTKLFELLRIANTKELRAGEAVAKVFDDPAATDAAFAEWLLANY